MVAWSAGRVCGGVDADIGATIAAISASLVHAREHLLRTHQLLPGQGLGHVWSCAVLHEHILRSALRV